MAVSFLSSLYTNRTSFAHETKLSSYSVNVTPSRTTNRYHLSSISTINLNTSQWSHVHFPNLSFGKYNTEMPQNGFIPEASADSYTTSSFHSMFLPNNDDDAQAMGFVQRPVSTPLSWRPPAIDAAYGHVASQFQPSHAAHSILQSPVTSSDPWASSMWRSPIFHSTVSQSTQSNTAATSPHISLSNTNQFVGDQSIQNSNHSHHDSNPQKFPQPNSNPHSVPQRVQRRRRGRYDPTVNTVTNSTDSNRLGSRPSRVSTDDSRSKTQSNGYIDHKNGRNLNGNSSTQTNGTHSRPNGVSSYPNGNHNGNNTNGKNNNSNGFQTVREFNRKISACARKRDLKSALAILDELDRAPGITRNLFTYNAIINALVMCSQPARADEFWQDMQKSGIEPNLVTFNTMLKSCFGGTDQDVNRGFRLLSDMQERGIAADRVTFNSLINACVSAGRVRDAHEVYEKMRNNDIMPDAYTFCTMAKQARHQCDVSMLEALLAHQLHHHTTTAQRDSSSRKSNNKVDSENVSPVAYNTIADAFIRCGYPDQALGLLKRLHDPQTQSVVSVKDSLPDDTIPVAPDVQTYNVRLKALRESGAPATEAFTTLDEMCSHGLEADHITLLTLADLCCRREEMSSAEGVLQAAIDADVKESKKKSPEWQALLNSPFKNDDNAGRHSPTRNSPPRRNGSPGSKNSSSSHGRRNMNQPRNAKANAALFNSLIRGYSSLDPPNVDKAVGLYREMQGFAKKQGFSWYAADSVTYTMLVDVFAKVGDAIGAEQIISEMEAAGRSNVVAYNAYLKANRGNGFQAALSILDRMKKVGLRPDVVTYNTIIDYLSSEENGTQIAEELVRVDMPRNGVYPDLLTFNTLIKGVARSRNNKGETGSALGAAYRWFGELQSRGLKPDEFTYQSMVSACAAAGDAPRALEFFRQVECERAKRVQATSPTNHISSSFPLSTSQALSNVTNSDQYSQSNRSYTDVHGTNTGQDSSGSPNSRSRNKNSDWMLLPHPAAYIALMRAFLSSGAADGVESVLLLRDEMVARGLELGRTGYTAVADAYAERADFNGVEYTLREMISRETQAQHKKLSPVHHCIRMKALCNACRLDDAIGIIPEVENADTAVFNVLIFACIKVKDMDRLIQVLRAMEIRNIEPDAITSRAMSSMMRTLARNLKTFDDRFVSNLSRMIGNMHLNETTAPQGHQDSGVQSNDSQGGN